MFQEACQTVRESVYGLVATTRIKKGKRTGTQYTNGSCFMISPGIVITSAHLTHINKNGKGPNHQNYILIRAPDAGTGLTFESANLIAEDNATDLALLKIDNPRSTKSVSLFEKIVPRGTSCGSLGFPLAQVKFRRGKLNYSARERFVGGYISNYIHIMPNEVYRYETDYIMYGGSSGCPGFLTNSNVFGLQRARGHLLGIRRRQALQTAGLGR